MIILTRIPTLRYAMPSEPRAASFKITNGYAAVTSKRILK